MSTTRDPHDENGLPPELRRVGEAVEGLSPAAPPAGLAERTVARIEREVFASASMRRLSLWLRPITHPAARIAAGFLLVATLMILTNPRTSERLGQTVEHLIGSRTTDKIEGLVDRALLAYGPVDVRGHENLSRRPPVYPSGRNGSPSTSLPTTHRSA